MPEQNPICVWSIDQELNQLSAQEKGKQLLILVRPTLSPQPVMQPRSSSLLPD